MAAIALSCPRNTRLAVYVEAIEGLIGPTTCNTGRDGTGTTVQRPENDRGSMIQLPSGRCFWVVTAEADLSPHRECVALLSARMEKYIFLYFLYLLKAVIAHI